jgi:hypothetical protein
MSTAKIVGGVLTGMVLLVAVSAGLVAFRRPAAATATASEPAVTAASAPESDPRTQGFLYGRITTLDGPTYQGRVRFGGSQEAFWSDYFNGVKNENPWLREVSPERLPKERTKIEIFGFTLFQKDEPVDIGRRFMTRFGEIARIEGRGRDVRVTLKSGAVLVLDRFDASDFDDGVRVWDDRHGPVDIDSLRIRTIDLLPTPTLAEVPTRLHGTVRTKQGDFTGFIVWNHTSCVGSDTLDGRSTESALSLRFDTIRSIERRFRATSAVTLLDGREIVLSGSRETGEGHHGIYVDDPRYGRVLIGWDAFERVDFSPSTSGPAFGDFEPGRPLMGRVTTADGQRSGRLVYDLDESETTATLDASAGGVDYHVPFGLIASIALEEGGARVTLHDGGELRLERTGDLGKWNAGVLIFAESPERPDHVLWADIRRIDFERK